MVLRDRFGRGWRIPSLIEHGDRLVRELLERSGRTDLEAWADARGLVVRMGRATRVSAIGYLVAGVVLALATLLRWN